jgi:glycogen debranching enzyme
LGFEQDAEKFRREASELSDLINEKMWDDARNFYFDLTIDETLAPIKTICAFWTLVSGAATPERAESLVRHLKNPITFGRLHPVPSLAADEKEYFPQGGYSSGAVWPPTNLMVIKGLERFGYDALAQEIALKHLDAVAQVYRQTGTFWENYAADFIKEGINVHGEPVVKDMVGWGGVAPILLFLEYGIGLRPDAPANRLSWKISTHERSGCKKFRFNGHVIDLIAEPHAPDAMKITVQSDGEFMLKITCSKRESAYRVMKGQNEIVV